jgi:hypothetical protein
MCTSPLTPAGCAVMLSSITTTCTSGSSFPTGQNLRGSTGNFSRDSSAKETHLCIYHASLSNNFSISDYTVLDARIINERKCSWPNLRQAWYPGIWGFRSSGMWRCVRWVDPVFWRNVVLSSSRSSSQRRNWLFLDCFTMKMKALPSFRSLETINLLQQHIPHDLNLQQ